MNRAPIADLNAFIAVAREGSFTRAAAQLGVSPSALSQTMRNLEETVGVLLLTRTTSSSAPSAAGERLVNEDSPYLEAIEAGLASLAELREKPARIIRLTAMDRAAETVLWLALSDFLLQYPHIQGNLVGDNTLRDIV